MGWFSKKPKPSPVESDRYKGKPLLILLENYVLDCIGCLSTEKRALVVGVVRQTFGGGEDWKESLRNTLKLNESLDESLRGMWIRNQDIARQTNQPLSPEDFARMIVDKNFSSLIDGRTSQ